MGRTRIFCWSVVVSACLIFSAPLCAQPPLPASTISPELEAILRQQLDSLKQQLIDEFQKLSELHQLSVDSVLKDFIVPSAPAAQILGKSDDNIRTPANLKEFREAVGSAVDRKGKILGEAMMECSPLLYVFPENRMSEITLERYQTSDFVRTTQNLRLSLAIQAGADTAMSNGAIGLSWLLYDAQDPAQNRDFIMKLRDELNYFDSKYGQILGEVPTESEDVVWQATPEEIAEYSARIDSLRRSYRRQTWNSLRILVAAAIAGDAEDGTIQHMQYRRFQGWLSGQCPLDPNMRLNVNAGGALNAEGELESVIGGIRVTFANESKGVYLEGTFDAGDKTTWRPSIGYERRLANGLWFAAAYTEEIQGRTSQAIFNFANLRWGKPERRIDPSLEQYR